MNADVDVLVVGAGISGLVAAFRLKERGATVEMFDVAARAGGVIGTRHRNGALVEHGPNSTLDTTPVINELLDRVGIRGERIGARPVAATRFVVRGGQLVALPASPGALPGTSAFSLGAKLRLLREPFIARGPARSEESIAAFVRRRLGEEFLDYAVDPFVSGIYAGDPERISVSAAFPRVHALEQKHGSLLRGRLAAAGDRKRQARASPFAAACRRSPMRSPDRSDASRRASMSVASKSARTASGRSPARAAASPYCGARRRSCSPCLRTSPRSSCASSGRRRRRASTRSNTRPSRASPPPIGAPTSGIRSRASAFSCRRRNRGASWARSSRAACSRAARRRASCC